MELVSLGSDGAKAGKHLAYDLYQKGARTIGDLSDPTNPYNLTEGQKVGIALYEDLNTRIPRTECKAIYEAVRDEAVDIDPDLFIDVMGSYRRGQETSGDVDFLITRDPSDGRSHAGVLKKLVDRLSEKGIITHEVSTHLAFLILS